MAVYFANRISCPAAGKNPPTLQAWSRHAPARGSPGNGSPLLAVAFAGGAVGVFTGASVCLPCSQLTLKLPLACERKSRDKHMGGETRDTLRGRIGGVASGGRSMGGSPRAIGAPMRREVGAGAVAWLILLTFCISIPP